MHQGGVLLFVPYIRIFFINKTASLEKLAEDMGLTPEEISLRKDFLETDKDSR